MMGSAATNAAAQDRKAAKTALREQRSAAALQAARDRLDAKLAKSAAKTGNIVGKGAIALLRAQTESTGLLAPVQSQAQIDVIDTEARAKFVKALPWIIGGVVVVGAIIFLRKRAKGRAS